MPTKKQGFAAMPKAKHLTYSSRGGKAKVPKGYAKLSPEARRKNAAYASNVRWERVKFERTKSDVGV